jgi:hypothetical protein
MLLDVFLVVGGFNEVSPTGTELRVVDSPVLELKSKVCIDRYEEGVEPAGSSERCEIWAIILEN